MGEVRPVSGMHQRKAEMAKQADAFIALPGRFPYDILILESVGCPSITEFSGIMMCAWQVGMAL